MGESSVQLHFVSQVVDFAQCLALLLVILPGSLDVTLQEVPELPVVVVD